ncbi:MAG: antitoxin [Lautropia sp.]|nr:antitoxin [Lautropia sp.]
MHTTTLRKVGGSVMLAVPPALLDDLKLQAGTSVDLSVDQGTLVVKPARPRYTLEELLQQYDAAAPATDEDRAWLDNGPVGNELL